MSHIVTIRTEVRDPAAIQAACDRLSLPVAKFRSVQLFSSTVEGWAVELRDWRYPIVCNVRQGKVHFDNYNGRWGSQDRLDQFLQGYAVEKAKLEARRKGYSVLEQLREDGSIKLTVNLGVGT